MALSIGELTGYVGLDAGPAEEAGNKITGMFDKLGGTWGKVLGLAGGAAGGLFAAGLLDAMGNEVGTDKLAASLGGGEAMSERLGKVAGKVYSNGFGAGLEDVNDALGAVMTSIKGMRNASDKDVQAMTEKAMTYADVMGVDVTRAAQVAGNMVANHMAKDGAEAFDLLMKASQKVPVQLREDVLDATDEYGQFFNQLGIKGPEAMGMLVASAGKGMYGIDKTGDALKEFTIRATDGSDATQTAMEAIGLSADKMGADLLAGGDRAHNAMGKVVDGLLAIKDPSRRANTSLALFGTPLEDLSTRDIPKFLRSLQGGDKTLGKFAGSVDKAGKTAYDNASTNLSMFGRKLKTEVVSYIGGKVLPALGDLTGKLNTGLGPAFDAAGDAAKGATKFLREHKTIAAILAGIIAGLIVVTAAHAAVLAVSAAGGMAAWLKSTKVVTLATKVWAATQWALNAALAANPIVLIVVALAALAVGLVLAYKKSETFRQVIHNAFAFVKRIAVAVGQFFTKKVPEFFGKAWDKAKSLTVDKVGALVGWVKGLPGRIVGALGSLKSKVSGAFGSAMEAARDKVTSIGARVVDWIRGIPQKLLSLAGKFGSAGRQLLQGFVDGMKNAAGIIAGIAGNVWTTVQHMLNGAIDKINAALDFTIHLPGPDLHVNIPDIPHLATGGRATSETLAVIGEGREPESVLPDSVLRGLLERAHAAGRDSERGRDHGRSAPLIGQVVQRQGESADSLAERLWFKTRTRG